MRVVFFLPVCMYVCTYVHAPCKHVPIAEEGSWSLELGLQMIVSHHVGASNHVSRRVTSALNWSAIYPEHILLPHTILFFFYKEEMISIWLCCLFLHSCFGSENYFYLNILLFILTYKYLLTKNLHLVEKS